MLREIETPQKFIEKYDIYTEVWYGFQRSGYYNKQFLHREDGPAFLRFRKDGELMLEIWYTNNAVHRIDGPAVIDYHPDGGEENVEYWLLGEFVLKEDFETPGFIDAFILENS